MHSLQTWARRLLPLCLLIRCGTAFASGPWDGSWFFDAQHSSSTHALQLSQAADGTWTVFDGYVEFKAVADGKAHRRGSSAAEVRAFQPDPQTLVIVRGIHGREYRHETLSISADGKTLTGDSRAMGWDGKERQTSVVYMRTAQGNSLQGFWKPVPAAQNPESFSAQPTPSKPAPQPAWVIWTGTDGMMTWFIPNTGETLRGKADMKLREIQGPFYDGTFFSWKQTSPSRLEFTAYIDGKPEEYAVETISADGLTFTDTLWAPGHEDSKVISVFHRQP